MDNILEKINKSTLRFLEPLNPEKTYELIVEEARKILKADEGSISLENKGELTKVYTTDAIQHQTKAREKGYSFRAYKEKEITIFTSEDVANIHPEIKARGIKKIIKIPLSYRNQSFGILTLLFKTDVDFTPEELEACKFYGSLASMAIKKTQLYDEASRALDVRDKFISMASHELRTPLTSINGYIELLYRKMKDGDSSESKWVVELYKENIRMTNLVKELLDINRIKTTGQLEYFLKECSVFELLERTMTTFSFNFPNHQIEFVNKVPVGQDWVIGDYDKLIQVFVNILNNAAKFSPEKSLITITMKNQKDDLVIEFQDRGKGIKGDISRIFEGFYKGENNENTGMGIGLLLSKHIIEYHHGEIEVSSEPNQGTLVKICLPKIDKNGTSD